MSNLAQKLEPKTAIEGVVKSLRAHGFQVVSHEERKREQRLQKMQQLKRCVDGHRKEVIPWSGTVICLDCDPEFARECGICTAPMWRCSC